MVSCAATARTLSKRGGDKARVRQMSDLFCYARFAAGTETLTCALDAHPDGTDHFDAVRHLWWRAPGPDVEFDLSTGWLTEAGTAAMPAHREARR